MKVTPDRATLFVDADNTLWDTDAVFARAQLELLAATEARLSRSTDADDRLGFVRAIDQALAQRHHAGLKYPPRLLVRAVELALGGATAGKAARAAWRGDNSYRITGEAVAEIEDAYFGALGLPPEVRPGVLEGLTQLAAAEHLLLIVTEGAKSKVERNAQRLGLRSFFDRIIEGPKAPALYRRVITLTGAPNRAFMIGDQLDRDIAPAKSAGLRTIYFPGGFQPSWAPNLNAVRPDHLINSFGEVPSIVLEELTVEPRRVAAR
jgi:putative hydrolase of the HAD superfamily